MFKKQGWVDRGAILSAENGIPMCYVHSQHGFVSYKNYLSVAELAKWVIEKLDGNIIVEF